MVVAFLSVTGGGGVMGCGQEVGVTRRNGASDGFSFQRKSKQMQKRGHEKDVFCCYFLSSQGGGKKKKKKKHSCFRVHIPLL